MDELIRRIAILERLGSAAIHSRESNREWLDVCRVLWAHWGMEDVKRPATFVIRERMDIAQRVCDEKFGHCEENNGKANSDNAE